MLKIVHLADVHYAAHPRQANLLDFMRYKMAGGLGGASFNECLEQGAAQRSHCPAIALGAAKFLAQNLLDHHVIVIGGDVGTTGFEVDQKAAYNFVKGTPGLRIPYRMRDRSITLGIRRNIAVMPGNHDRFQDQKCKSNGTVFNDCFAKEWGNAATRVKVYTAKDTTTGKVLRMVAGDFCLQDDNEAFPPGYPFCCGQGTVNPAVLEEMSSRTKKIREEFKDDGIIWLSHFPPYSDLAGFFPALQLNGHLDLVNEARSNNVDLILSGHIHDNKDRVENGVRVLTVGSSCSFMEPSGNWIRSISIDVNKGAVSVSNIVDYKWNRKAKIFE